MSHAKAKASPLERDDYRVADAEQRQAAVRRVMFGGEQRCEASAPGGELLRPAHGCQVMLTGISRHGRLQPLLVEPRNLGEVREQPRPKLPCSDLS
jgi:hypothetical protein